MLYISDNIHRMAHHVAKFHKINPLGHKVIGTNMLNYKPIINRQLKKLLGNPHPLWGMG